MCSAEGPPGCWPKNSQSSYGWSTPHAHYNRALMRRSPNHLTRPTAGALLLLMSLAPAAHALDAIQLEVREITVAGVKVNGATARLDLLSDEKTRVVLRAREALLPDPAGKFTNVSLVCDQPVVAEPRFG